MHFTEQFRKLVKKTAQKNRVVLTDLSIQEIESECWVAVAMAIQRWNGSKGKLFSWVYTTLTGRMKDLRKKQKYNNWVNGFERLDLLTDDGDTEEFDSDFDDRG
jgi:DNA-directed RNA polymerase specialized sigma24 family protein